MKKETKELIRWLKDHLSHYRNQLAAGQVKIGLVNGEEEVRKSYEVINFLNSLPEIEAHLSRGGYIPDKNNTPCCDGDSVRFVSASKQAVFGLIVLPDKPIEGKLEWNKHEAAFRIVWQANSEEFWTRINYVSFFEKVTK